MSSSAPLGITAIASVAKFGLVSAPYTGLLYLAVAFLAAMGCVAPKAVGLLFVLPQQLVLLVSAFGALTAMATGTFADGALRPVSFIVADQSPIVLVTIFHILSVYKSYFLPDKICANGRYV